MDLCHHCQDSPLENLRPRLSTVPSESQVTLTDALTGPKDVGFRIGTLEDIEARSAKCSLCGLIKTVVSLWCPTDPAHIHYEVSFSPVGEVHGYKWYNGQWAPNNITKSVQISRMQVRLQASARSEYPISNQVSRSFEFELFAKSQNESSMQSNSCEARLRPQHCNMTLLQSWLKQCREMHITVCDKARLLSSVTASARQKPYEVKLIDVTKRCLVPVPSSKLSEYQYVALSYVWGTDKQPLGLYQNNAEVLHQEGGISTASRTIEDAMKVTQELGYQFMWADVLCVMQDDASQKAADISHMYQIYTTADLTIISAGNGTASGGLPGISHDRAIQASTQIMTDLKLFTASQQPIITQTGIALDCRWSTRGWTLQEQVLSRRCLFFLEDQVMWRCQSCDRFEDFALEQTPPEPLHLRIQWARPQSERSRYVTDEPKPQHVANIFYIEDMFNFHDNFRTLAQAYARRTLTFNSDIEDAFQGILTGLAKDFHKGLPIEWFEDYLCWTRNDPETQPLCRRLDCPLPSWSWMAWSGSISFEHTVSNTCPKIVCYRLISKDKTESQSPVHDLRAINPKHFAISSHGTFHEDSNMSAAITKYRHQRWQELLNDPELVPSVSEVENIKIDLNHLIFYADVAESLEVSHVCFLQAERQVWIDSYRIVDRYKTDQTVLDFEELHQENSKTEVVDASSAQVQERKQAKVQRKKHVLLNQSLFAIAELVYVPPHDNVSMQLDSVISDKVYIMRVSRHNGVAQREGLHIVDSALWNQVRKRRELIVLV